MDQLSFADILNASTLTLSTGGTITVAAILVSMSASLICGTAIALIYRQAYEGVLFQKSYAMTIIMICLVTTMVIMVISGNLVLSLGMVGALSIVRFRAAIKDPIDIVYIFWAVGVGIANGVAYFSVSFIASLFIGLSLLIAKNIKSRPVSNLIIINCANNASEAVISKIDSLVKRTKLRSQTNKVDGVELVFETMSYGQPVSLGEISNIEGVNQSRIINYTANN
jgi:uncharacterized membrane protein YhiD involved in acid resistance